MSGKDTFGHEQKNKNRGIITSFITHILLILLLILPMLQRPEIEDLGAILISFGDPDAGAEINPVEDKVSATASSASSKSSTSKNVIDNIHSDAKDETAPLKASEKKKTNSTTVDNKTTEKNKQEEAKRKEESDRAAIESAEKAKTEKDARELANQKKKYSDLLGKGQGNNNSGGNQGTEKGSPDGKALEGISKGSGRIGGGLSGRGVEYEPSFSDNSQKTGKVTLSICVSNDGKVSKADFTQKGSTTSDPYLVEIARKSALKYRFSKSENESQCGTVTIDFKVR